MNGCFSGGITPTDIDGCVERNGHFLFIEAKPTAGFSKKGQALAFKRLAAQPNTTFLYLYGELNAPTAMSSMGAYRPMDKVPADITSVRIFCRGWFEMAEGGQT